MDEARTILAAPPLSWEVTRYFSDFLRFRKDFDKSKNVRRPCLEQLLLLWSLVRVDSLLLSTTITGASLHSSIQRRHSL